MNRVRKTFASTLLVATLAAAGYAATPAAAADPGRKPVTVEYRYQSWESPETNYKNIRRIVKRACSAEGPRPLSLQLKEQECMSEMMNRAIEGLGRQQLAALHDKARGRATS
jgi:UrcA family protein